MHAAWCCGKLSNFLNHLRIDLAKKTSDWPLSTIESCRWVNDDSRGASFALATHPAPRISPKRKIFVATPWPTAPLNLSGNSATQRNLYQNCWYFLALQTQKMPQNPQGGQTNPQKKFQWWKYWPSTSGNLSFPHWSEQVEMVAKAHASAVHRNRMPTKSWWSDLAWCHKFGS